MEGTVPLHSVVWLLGWARHVWCLNLDSLAVAWSVSSAQVAFLQHTNPQAAS